MTTINNKYKFQHVNVHVYTVLIKFITKNHKCFLRFVDIKSFI